MRTVHTRSSTTYSSIILPSRPFAAPFGAAERENCELSDRDSRELDPGNPSYFETTADYDFYERFNGRQGIGGECLDGERVLNMMTMILFESVTNEIGKIKTNL